MCNVYQCSVVLMVKVPGTIVCSNNVIKQVEGRSSAVRFNERVCMSAFIRASVDGSSKLLPRCLTNSHQRPVSSADPEERIVGVAANYSADICEK